MKVVCETRDMEHANQLKQALLKNYQKVVFGEIPAPSILPCSDEIVIDKTVLLNESSTKNKQSSDVVKK